MHALALAAEDLDDQADAEDDGLEPVRRRTRKVRDEHRRAVAGWLAEDAALSGPEVKRRLRDHFGLDLARSKCWALVVEARMAPMAAAVAEAMGGDGAAMRPAWETVRALDRRPAPGPPTSNLVVMTGVGAWDEAGYGQEGRHDCPVCVGRDLDRERRLGLNRYCARCQCWTWDWGPYAHPKGPGRRWLASPKATDPRRLTRRMRRQAAQGRD